MDGCIEARLASQRLPIQDGLEAKKVRENLFSWLLDPKNALDVAAWGFILNIAGILLAVFGFALTWWQLWRTANATRAAATAVENIKSRVATYDAVFEISRATSATRETERHLKRHGWQDAIESYTEFRNAIIRLIELPSALQKDHRDLLRAMHSDATAFSNRIESAIGKGRPPGDVGRSISSNRNSVENLCRISIFLEGVQ